uniref:Uncharacterized protein n=1 Tax=Hyaloperonospora arabidopsidis (strain Emoy2) TaxID=559515 RepID=M4BIP9_HYAAE
MSNTSSTNDQQLHSSSSSSSSSSTQEVAESLRCQYSSKRCENERTHKKSGGLHKFCAMHREKANRNQMRLDHRRRVLKQQQKELQRQRLAQQIQAQQQLYHRRSSALFAAGRTGFYPDTTNQMQPSPFDSPKPLSSPCNTMTGSMNLPVSVASPPMEMPPQVSQESSSSALPLFDQHDLTILEAMLFSSDEEQNGDASPMARYSSASRLDRSPSFVNV